MGPLDHAEGLPPASDLDGEQIDAFHGEAKSESVPGVVETEIFDPGDGNGGREGLLSPSQIVVTLTVREC